MACGSAWSLSISYLLLTITKQHWIQTLLVAGVSLYMASLIGAFVTVYTHGDLRQAYTARTIFWIIMSMFSIVFQGLLIVGIMRTMKH